MLDTVSGAVLVPAVDDYWFDHAAAGAAVRFFADHLRLTKDKWAGKPFTLEAWQADGIVRPLFGWKRANGTRRFRRLVAFLPRKNGKTELAAGLGLLMLVGDGTIGPEVYAIAKDKEQARFHLNSKNDEQSQRLGPVMGPFSCARVRVGSARLND